MEGIYIILVELKKDSLVKIGSLGNINFDKGLYAYIGSAQKNLEKRVLRHLKKRKKLHWHIDYFLKIPNANVIQIYYKKAEKKEECKTAKRLSVFSDSILGFGCSDCGCESHMFKVKNFYYDFFSQSFLKFIS